MFKRKFGKNQHKLTDFIEIQQVFLLLFEGQKTSSIAKDFLRRTMREMDCTLEDCLQKEDERGNNFFHLTDCRYAPPFWKPFIKD